MKFFVCIDTEGVTFDCVTNFIEAKRIVHHAGGGEITSVDVPVNAESIKRLLGNLGGYATSSRVYTIGAGYRAKKEAAK